MAYFEVTKEVEFDYGHRIANHKSKCRNVHGHRGKVQVTIQGRMNDTPGASDNAMVMDFGDIKDYLTAHVHDVFDHVMIVDKNDEWFINGLCKWTNDTLPPIIKTNFYGNCWDIEDFGVIQFVNGPPTAENLADIIYECLSQVIDSAMLDQYVMSVRFWETPTSMAEVKRLTFRPSDAKLDAQNKPLSYDGCTFSMCEHMHLCSVKGCIHPRNTD